MNTSILTSLYQNATPSLEQFIVAWGHLFPLLYQLEATPQDPLWHYEGNVKIHTQMVLNQVYSSLEREPLPPDQRVSLILAALFHDIAKPISTKTREEDGRIISPRHADKGRSYLALRLLELGLNEVVYQTVLALVGHHHDPLKLVRDEAPPRQLMRLARLCNPQLLYRLEWADLSGRTASDTAQQLENLELFRMLCQEAEVWDAPPYLDWGEMLLEQRPQWSQELREFALQAGIRDFESGTIHTPLEAVARGHRFEQGFAKVTLTCGISGSGKSSWVRENFAPEQIVSLDQLRGEITGDVEDQSHNGQVMQAAKERLKVGLRTKKHMVWDATNVRWQFRQIPLCLGLDYGAQLELIVFATTPSSCYTQNRSRAARVPDAVLSRQLETFDFPYLDEAHRVKIVFQQLNKEK